jgi:hypothetical protein
VLELISDAIVDRSDRGGRKIAGAARRLRMVGRPVDRQLIEVARAPKRSWLPTRPRDQRFGVGWWAI